MLKIILSLTLFFSIIGFGFSNVKLNKDIKKIYTKPTYHQFYYEVIKPGIRLNPYTEGIGLMSYKFVVIYNSGFGLGIGTFGAFSGTKSGFMGVGPVLNYEINLSENIKIIPEVFSGISGGSNVLQKNGFFLRPSILLGFKTEAILFFIGYSAFFFTDTNKETYQPFLGINFNSDLSFISLEDSNSSNLISNLFHKNEWKWGITSVAPYAKYVFIKNSSKNDLIIGGIRLDHFLNKYFFTVFEVGGVIIDAQNDFAVFTVGPAVFIPVFHGISIAPKMTLGFCGGGNINVGGGAIIDGGVEIIGDFGIGIKPHLITGYLYSFNGSFKAPYAGASLSFNFASLEKRSYVKKEEEVIVSNIHKTKFGFTLSSERHFLRNKYSSVNFPNGIDIDLFGINVDFFPLSFLYLSGGLYWPYSGIEKVVHASASTSIGLLSPSWKGFSVGLKLKLGTVSGDQILSPRNLIASLGGDINFAIEEESGIYLFFSGGKVQYFDKLNAYFAEIGIRYMFDLPWKFIL